MGRLNRGAGSPAPTKIIFSSAARARCPRAVEPGFESLRSEGWDRALLGNSGNEFCYVAEEWELRGQVREAGNVRCQVRPDVDVAENVCAARTPAAFVVVGEKLGLVGGDIDADGTVTLASL